MADQEEEDLRMALRMSLHSPPEAKRSKPRENVVVPTVAEAPEESPEVKNRKLQRELMAAAAEKRMMTAKSATVAKVEKSVPVAIAEKSGVAAKVEKMTAVSKETKGAIAGSGREKVEAFSRGEEKKVLNLGEELPLCSRKPIIYNDIWK